MKSNVYDVCGADKGDNFIFDLGKTQKYAVIMLDDSNNNYVKNIRTFRH